MKYHLLHVKNGHCSMVEHLSGRYTMIDIHYLNETEVQEQQLVKKGFLLESLSPGGYVKDATNPIYYWREHFGYNTPFRVILSHPDKDHVKGIKKFYEEIGFGHLWMPTAHIDTLPNSDDGWFIKSVVNGSNDNPKFLEPKRSDDKEFYGVSQDHWDHIEILHPSAKHLSESSNQGSYLLKFHYGKSSVIVAGDVEDITFDWLLNYYPNDLKCTVLIASHHGRQTGWPGKKLIEHMDPLMVLIPKGKLQSQHSAVAYYNNVLGKERVLTTTYAGNIRFELDRNDDIRWINCDRPFVNSTLTNTLGTARANRNLNRIFKNFI